MRKLLLLSSFIFATAGAQATQCAGELASGKFVIVEVTTWGSLGVFGSASVEIFDEAGFKLRGYEVVRESVQQFAEDFAWEGNVANPTLGSIIFKADEGSVFINYRGINYVHHLEHKTLFGILKDSNRKKQPNNLMVVWQGPGEDRAKSYEFRDVVCAFEQDI
ncbi:hypothetical protein GW915_03145 [bacterium]|nr:hypothetical protein [bacterium]